MDIADLIRLQDSKVVNVSIDKRDNIFITVETTESSVACHVCGKQLTKRHGCDQERKLRHLSILRER